MVESQDSKLIEIILDDEAKSLVNAVAKKKGLRFEDAAQQSYSSGIKLMMSQLEEWEEDARNAGIMEDIERLRQLKAEKRKRLMDLNSESIAETFSMYEEFNKVSKMLISYLGKHAEAKRLKSMLEEKGIQIDISHGEIPDIDGMTQRYVFKKEKDERTINDV